MELRGRRTRFGFCSGHQEQDREERQDRPPPRASTSGKQAARLPGDLRSTWQAMERETGWQPEVALMPYSKLVVYCHVTPADARGTSSNCGGVWVDIVGGDGKPLRRNVGLLRYLGGVAFASDGSTWAGIQLHGLRLEGNENDGCVDGIRYFVCPKGQGLFIPERLVRRSFVQRPAPPLQPFLPSPAAAASRIPPPRVYRYASLRSWPQTQAETFPSLAALLRVPSTGLDGDDRAGVIHDVAKEQVRVRVVSAAMAPKVKPRTKAAKTIVQSTMCSEVGSEAGHGAAVTGAGDATIDGGTSSESRGSAASGSLVDGQVQPEAAAGSTERDSEGSHPLLCVEADGVVDLIQEVVMIHRAAHRCQRVEGGLREDAAQASSAAAGTATMSPASVYFVLTARYLEDLAAGGIGEGLG